MDDYLRWMTRKDSDRRAVILKQTLIDNDITMDKWLKQNQHCNDKDILAKRSEYFDLNQDEIYQLQQKQQENKRNIEYLKKRNDELWTKNDELVNENRFQEKELDGYDLDLKHQLKKVDKLEQHINDNASYTEHIEYLLTQQQARNKSLKNEVSRLNALVGKLVNREHLGTNRIQREKEENQTLRREIIDLELEAAALRKELITLQGRYDRMSKCREGSATSVNRHERSGICSQKTTHKKSPKPGRSLIRENAMSFKAVDTLNRYDVNSLERERELFHAKINELENQLHSLRRERDSLYDELNKTVLPGSEHSNHFWREIQVVQPNTTYQHNEVSSSKHNPDDKLARSQLNRQLISCRQEKRLANDKIQEQEYIIRRLREEKEKLIQENRKQRSYYKEMAMHFQQDTEKREQKTQSVLNEELENDRSKTAVLSIEINKSAEILHEVTKELESEKSRNAILLTKSNQYREKMKQAYVDLSNYHAPLMQENRQSTERTATENNQQLERSLFDLFRLNEDMKGEVGSLNDKATKLTDTIEEKDKNISKLQSELQRKYQEIADRQGDLVLLKETNVKNERLISDLQTEMKQFQMKFKETSPDSERITDTIIHLEREVEEYKNEMKKTREEIEHATDKNLQMNRNISDLKISELAWSEKMDSLNDQIKELTKRKDNEISRLEIKLQRKCQEIENAMVDVALIKGRNEKNEQLVTDLQIELDQYKANLKDKDSNSEEINFIATTLRRKVETYESELKQAREEIRNATEKSQQMDRTISAFKNSEQSLVDERDSFKDKIIELTTILKRRDSEIREMETKMAEFSSIKEKIIKLENDKSCHLAEMSRTISNLKREMENIQSELNQAREETRKSALQLKFVNDEHGNCQNRIASLRKENEKLRSMPMYKDDQTRCSEAVISKREQELSLALKKAQRELREVQHELDDTKTRLSKVMGQKLTDNNPNIADLSDKNRPTKLAERYSELYDNQWTDAFEVVNKQLQDDKITIDSLIDILMNAAKFCRGESMKQLEEIQGILLPKKVGLALPSLVYKNLKDCRKALGDLTGAAVYEKYMEENARLRLGSLQQDVKPFVKECIELCWLMSIQDPPVTIEPVVQRGTKFDTDFYKAYTSSGPLVDYVVWPALCLHEKGPLLCKGIAQGYGGKKTKY